MPGGNSSTRAGNPGRATTDARPNDTRERLRTALLANARDFGADLVDDYPSLELGARYFEAAPPAHGVQALLDELRVRGVDVPSFTTTVYSMLGSGEPEAAPEPERVPVRAGRDGVFRPVATANVLRLAEVTPVPWLWRDRVPAGKVTLIAGDAGLGKSMLGCDLAARVSAGQSWPDGARCEAGGVVLVSMEDDPADTVVPRLIAHGADLSRIVALSTVTTGGHERGFTFGDLPALEEALDAVQGARLAVLDPAGALVGNFDDSNNSEVRGMLDPLSRLAAERSVAIVIISHTRKAMGRAVHSAAGSLAWTAAARAVFAVVRDPDDGDRRFFAPIKCNLAQDRTGLAYLIKGDPARVEWGGAAGGLTRRLPFRTLST